MSDQVRVRFAPSPTGFLHIGGVRTALFNFLFARKERGSFLLRIEDTDRERSQPEFEKEILDSLKWLGLTWDGEILRQSARLSVYQKAAQELIQNGFAYRVEEAGKIAVKFKIPKEKVEFQDLVHGPIEFDAVLLDDLVIVKSDGYPTYHFACVVDDHHMGITHVIRGDDHISNTPRQILIYKALGWNAPKFGHLPLVFGSDKTPLSKRHGAVSLSVYRKEGYLPEGIVNYLALLGWSPGGNEEMFTLKELIGKFQIESINKTNACFDPEKLKWTNGEHVRRLNNSDYLERLIRFLEDSSVVNRPRFQEIALLYKERIRTFSELMEQASFFFREAVEYDPKACAKHFKDLETKERLAQLSGALEKIEDFFDLSKLELCVRKAAEGLGLEGRALIHPLRVAISGRSVTPGLFEVMSLLGKEEVLKRIQYVIINFNRLRASGE